MFKDLHRKKQPLVICNVWDVSSALVAEQKGFEAIGTSSAAIAKILGKDDGENVLFEELLSIVAAISNLSSLPVTVDLESGYGDSPEVIAKNISELAKVGVVGVNIEDSKVIHGERLLSDAIEFANKLKSIKTLLHKMNITMFVNVRSDTYLLNIDNTLEVSIKRIEMYQRAGADGIFLPCIKTPDDIKAVVANTKVPINVMCVPELPDFDTLEELGVKRISMGNFLHEAMLDSFSSMLSAIVAEKSFERLFR
ncbi:MAG: isocitrate lyase/phosphoenolpyruvate mutase family protein [Shewanella sp.]|nr:isocitrate lyase/phosphoenolpyruvate mutase family protein [Shewanella sp.]